MQKLFLSAILLLSVWDFSEAQTDYCSICADHTMCKYPTDEPSPMCHRVLHAEVSKEDIQTILDVHNFIRTKIASGNETSGRYGRLPPASDMQVLTWNDELANIALRWALQCVPSTDTCRNVDQFNVGQNVVYFKCTDCKDEPPDWKKAIYSWYKTVDNLSKYDISPFHYSSSCGPYTQMVWSRTNRIGCAVVKYISPDNYWIISTHVCNYGPAGNILGPQTQIYGVGRPCSWCQQFCQQGVLCQFPNN